MKSTIMLFWNIYTLYSTSFFVFDIILGKRQGGLQCSYGHEWDYTLEKCVSCKDGFYGADCNTPCSNGRYGKHCELICTCAEQDCHHIYGCKKNPSECEVGKIGLYCELPCPYPAFGKQCQRKCDCGQQHCDTKHGCIGASTLNKEHITSTRFHVFSSISQKTEENASENLGNHPMSAIMSENATESTKKVLLTVIMVLMVIASILLVVYVWTFFWKVPSESVPYNV
ncbi:multiple epidermal growth factor-like domains protein 10 isoform X2 [Saccostrea cucullata]|uniref:multiple epidermal growth factor-like domains protein 10 isoform X2 n=1 Tax=Saccostrea cuccullata TaxID=36930 RepID=UPI002ED06FFA